MDTRQATEQVIVNVQDIYSWRASYSDTEYLDETNAVGGFASVDQKKCICLTLLYRSSVPVHAVAIPEGSKPVFFRRRRIVINLMDESNEPQETVHCIGWKRDENDAAYLFVFENGHTLLSNDLQAV